MKQFGKILKFEFMGYLKNKMFVGITLFLVLVIAVVMFLPNIISAFSSGSEDDGGEILTEDLPIMLIYSETEGLAELVKTYFDLGFTDYNIKIASGDIEDVKREVADGTAECAFVMSSPSSYTYYVDNLSMYDMNTELANSLLQEVYRMNAMIENGLTPEEVENILSVTVDGQVETLGKNQMDNFFYTYIMIFALYMVILLYGQMVATNVATEKSSRAMELLITSAKPTSMMFGKIMASCLAGFCQLVLIFGSAIVFYNINKDALDNPLIASIFDIPVDLFIYMIIYFILGFLIYAFLFGAIGSTASKLEDINTSVMPVTFLFIIAFMVVMFSMTEGSVDNTLMVVCSYIPFSSPMAMFTRIAMSTVAWYEIAISIAILIASVIGVGILSSAIYRVGVLLYGKPPKITSVLKTVLKKNS